ncbi:hypothetical protein QN277_019609 [Acacia crassicarpa]|uniref:Uncharacterized protein n=1 Tax=Acacia crassicarpa TaxID=499986 RepID=A0AAE1JI04_9FABA|nr:hypothetical protein QN277_019609 [Acacia crassicarpa]
MAWFNGNQDSPFQSHSFVGDSTRREESISQSIDSILQTIRTLQANWGIQDEDPIGQKCHGSFHHPYHEPYHPPPFQPTHSPYPPYRSYHEPSPPPYNPYYEPSHNPPPYNRMPYHEPPHSFHPTSRPYHPSHESLTSFDPPSGSHSQSYVPNREPTIREVLAKLQNQVDQTVDEKRSHKANFDQQMDSVMRRMEQQEKENERMEKEIERLTQQAQVLKSNCQENPILKQAQEVEQLEKSIEESSLPFADP